MTDMLLFKEAVNKSKNRNTKFVRVKAVRNCRYCKKEIGVGTESLTTNKKSEGRRWVCLDCLDAVLRCAEVKAKLDSVAFDDDGYYMALSEALDKDLAELVDRDIISCNDDLTF